MVIKKVTDIDNEDKQSELNSSSSSDDQSSDSDEEDIKEVPVLPVVPIKVQHTYINIFPKLVPKLDIGLRTPLLKNGCYTLAYVDILSLEPAMSNSDRAEIKKTEKGFVVGWLTDEIINSFLEMIAFNHQDALIVSWTIALSISCGKSFRNLWKGTSLKRVKNIIIPFNPNGGHWILIVLKVKNQEIIVLDPMTNR